MKAEELRIGNYVHEKYYNRGYKFEPIKLKDILSTHIVCSLDNAHNFEDIEPIPLTEEILLKCGFEFFDNERIFNNFVIEDFHNGNYYFTAGEGIKLHEKHIEYLHQLQNLYFSLTGEELNVKL